MTSHPSDQPEPAALRSSYVIPFGRVLGQNDGDPPVNEVLVGREDERAYFVNLLVSRGPTGSYLVTGRRGVGKSSFVRHCLTEYGAAVFKRFLRSNSGKSFWDFSILALLSFISIVLAMSMSELSALLFLTSFASTDGRILQIVAVLLVILCLFPLVYARQIIETVLRTRPFINARDERSLDPARRPPWEDQELSDVLPHQRFQYRQMERLTFPWMTFTTLLQTLSITVNLGFDKLDHRSVIQAMLVGLRHEYSRQFLAWHSG